jgi:Phage major capsid protein E
MADLFSTNVMLSVVNSLIVPQQFLLSRYFPQMQTETSEEIHFDVVDKTRRLAPFVSPVVVGKVVQSQGFTTKTFKPAYIKDKRVFESNRPFKRSAGEPIGGSLDPMNRRLALLASELQDQVEMIDRRLEVMAAEALRTGAVTITGDLYPTVNVNFGRAAANTVILAGAARWNQAGINPLDSLQDWSQLVLQKSGAMPFDVIMTVDVWKIFRENSFVKARLEKFNGPSPIVQDAQVTEGGVFMGNVDGYNIYVYAGWYVDDNNVEQPILPAGTVLMGGAQIQGIRAFGAIRDEDAGFQALPYYCKSWIDPDPSVRYLLMQSAPLVVPTRVNASFAATVL